MTETLIRAFYKWDNEERLLAWNPRFHPGRRYAEEKDNDIHELMIFLEGSY
jgi:hypothetical protein